jgi:exodeoxyribonuclease-5
MQGKYPQFGERVVCLKNNYEYGMMNGEMFNVTDCTEFDQKWLTLNLYNVEDGRSVESVLVHKTFFDNIGAYDHELRRSAHFDFGYAMTVHKSQGSQWQRPLIVDESDVFRDKKWKWLYTGITRAAESVTIVRGKV